LLVGLEKSLISLRRRGLRDDILAFESACHTRTDVDVLNEPRSVGEFVTRSRGDVSGCEIPIPDEKGQ
jgi:hypothetical protein